MATKSKVFNDCVHGHIEIDPLCVAIIDTPQFQRLRHLKQMGGGYYVFPGATHNRFEHCIGVCHLAGQLIERLKFIQPELTITENHVKCVKIAGLCHDLGHGPFSHAFDGMFMPRAAPDNKTTHEDLSTLLFDHLLEENETIKEKLTPCEQYFIKDLIHPQYENQRPEQRDDDMVFLNEPRKRNDMAFLYEIIANKENGVDVDKWDYFARDCHQLGITNSFDHTRLTKFARVIRAEDGRRHICFRDKEEKNVYNMFYTRNALHHRACQHVVKQTVDFMLMDALLKADVHLIFYGENRESKRMSTFGKDMVAFSQMTDHVYHQILHGEPRDGLREAREILCRLERRDLYRCICETKPRSCSEANDVNIETIKKRIVELSDNEFEVEDFEILKVQFNYGKGEENPVKSVYFYEKSAPETAYKIPEAETDAVTLMLPSIFCEVILRFFWKKEKGNRETIARQAILDWIKEDKGWQASKKRGHP